ncbi:MAG: SDR family NAD(P)-dependent oxidoreductase [Chlorobium sp.]
MNERYERIAIVTGATSGIGEATAKKFAAVGFGVVGNGRNGTKLATLEQEIGEAQQRAFPRSAADIVIVGSVVGRHISPFSAVYGATKFAVHSLAEGLRREVGTKGVRVSLVEPGIVLSGFQSVAGYSDELVDTFQNRFGPLFYFPRTSSRSVGGNRSDTEG